MTTKLEQLEGLKRQLTVTVSVDDLQKVYQKKLNKFCHAAKLKGFRPGKIPTSVIEQKFSRGLLYETASELIDATLKTQLTEQNIKIASRPEVNFNHETVRKDQPFDYVVTFEVYPEIQLKNLNGIDIESLSGEVTDEDVSAKLIQMRTHHAEWQAVDRPSKLGDRVKIDFEGEVDGKPLEQGSAKDHWLELGSHKMIPGFEEGLIDAKKDDVKTLNIAFPDNYHVEELRQKPVVFKVTVAAVEEPKLPALDEAFAKKFNVDSVDALKAVVKKNLQAELDETAKALLKRTALDKLMVLNNVEIPVAAIDAEVIHLQNMTRQQIRQFNKKATDEEIKNFPLAREPYVEEAKKRVLLGLLLGEVIKANHITVDQEKVDERLKEMAQQYGSVEQMLPALRENKPMVADIEAFLLEEQALKILLDAARVSHVKKSYDAIMAANK